MMINLFHNIQDQIISFDKYIDKYFKQIHIFAISAFVLFTLNFIGIIEAVPLFTILCFIGALGICFSSLSLYIADKNNLMDMKIRFQKIFLISFMFIVFRIILSF